MPLPALLAGEADGLEMDDWRRNWLSRRSSLSLPMVMLCNNSGRYSASGVDGTLRQPDVSCGSRIEKTVTINITT